jgi:hypothetical protein
VTIYRPDPEHRMASGTQELTAESLLPRLRIALPDLFGG